MIGLWTGFLMGLLGSFHCVGMCGAIALSIPMDFSARIALIRDAILYNSGRVITYALIGILLGYFGETFFRSGYQQWLAFEVGILIVIVYFIPDTLGNKIGKWLGFNHLTNFIKKSFNWLLHRPSPATFVLIGMLNGLLPCGFVYMAGATAILADSMSGGVMHMAGFGLGTIPMMLTTVVSSQFISIKVRNAIKGVRPYLAMLLATLFILRGLGLGIPYVSPKPFDPNQKEAVYCHPVK
ncbi:sulfite exporter TauE/SafE family protein [Rhodoflexus sp.]